MRHDGTDRRAGLNEAGVPNRDVIVINRYRKELVEAGTKINKFIHLPALKHHQSAGVMALKNMSHGLMNNVSRSHSSPTLNACGTFIPAVVNLPVIRQNAALHIVDGVRAS